MQLSSHLVAAGSWEARCGVYKERLEVTQVSQRLKALWRMLGMSALPLVCHRLTVLTSFTWLVGSLSLRSHDFEEQPKV